MAEELRVTDADEDDLYEAMDWLLAKQDQIERRLAKQHIHEGDRVLYDVSSSYYEGHTCTLAHFGHNRDGKKGKPIIVYGIMTDDEGRPIAVRVYPGNTGDPSTVSDQVDNLRGRFGLGRVVLIGDRGMLTQSQIENLKRYPGLGWISALRSEAIQKLVAGGMIQTSLFDQHNIAEISSPDFPGERLIACFNPLLCDERRRKRSELLAAVEEDRKRRGPVAPATPSLSAKKKKATRRTNDGFMIHSLDTLLTDLGTRCKNRCRMKSDSTSPAFYQTTDHTPLQMKAFQLLGLA